jgi:uncharacterized HhH-GPD family protein
MINQYKEQAKGGWIMDTKVIKLSKIEMMKKITEIYKTFIKIHSLTGKSCHTIENVDPINGMYYIKYPSENVISVRFDDLYNLYKELNLRGELDNSYMKINCKKVLGWSNWHAPGSAMFAILPLIDNGIRSEKGRLFITKHSEEIPLSQSVHTVSPPPINDTISTNTDQYIVNDMLAFVPPKEIGVAEKVDDLSCWGLTKENSDLLHNNHNALLFGAIFDFMIAYEKAWWAPYELKRRLGHLDTYIISQIPTDLLQVYIQNGSHGSSLHRFPSKLAERIISACKLLNSKYSGNARNIWPDGTSANVVVERLEEFSGISQKISHMLCRLLGCYFGVSLTNWEKIDVAVDRHVARVFLRTGLVQKKNGVHNINSIRQEIIDRARILNPSYPGSLDEPAFTIGLKWCTSEIAKCNAVGQPCPLYISCRKCIEMKVA